MVNLSISIWEERCILSKAKFRDSDHELVLHNCLTLLQEITGYPTQILTTDWDSLIVEKRKLDKYELGTLENWLLSIRVSSERKLQEEYE